jgi:pilus assembly protein CpaE
LSVVVFDSLSDPEVTPLNLAAALKKDCPARTVRLFIEAVTGSLATRARRAGVELVSDLQFCQTLPKDEADTEFLDEADNVPSVEVESLPNVELDTLGEADDPAETDVDMSANCLSGLPMPTSESFAVGPLVNSRELALLPSARVIGFISGRGGVGKSSAALLLGLIAARQGKRVAVIETDLQFGNLSAAVGHEQGRSIICHPVLKADQRQLQGLISDVQHAADQVGNPKLLLLSAPDRPEEADRAAECLPDILSALAESFDLLLIDTGSYWTEAQALAVRSCTQLVFMMDQRPASLVAARRLYDLCLRLQIPEARFRYLLNGCGRGAPLTAQDVSLVFGGQDTWTLDDGGSLVDELFSLGCPDRKSVV